MVLGIVVYFERPILKKARQIYATQYSKSFDYKKLPSVYLKQFNIKIDEYVSHHRVTYGWWLLYKHLLMTLIY